MHYNQPFDQPSNPNAPYVDGAPQAGIEGSIPPAAAIEFPQREIINVITAAGIVPSNADLTQLLQAILALGASPTSLIHWGLDYGTANAMLVTASPILRLYAPGTVVVTIPAADNTGPTTINVNNLGNQNVVRPDGTAIQPHDIHGGYLTFLVHDGTAFRIAFTLPAPTSIIYEGTDTGTANALVVNAVVPPLVSITAGMNFLITKAASASTGPVTLNLLGTTAPVKWADGSPLYAGDWPASVPLLLDYNGTAFLILSSPGPSVQARGVQSVVTYNTPGTFTYTPSLGTKAILVECQGGGGSGGGTNAPGAGAVCVGTSAGAGGYCRKYILASGWATAAVVVGAGGPANPAGANGSNGGQSSFTCTGSALVASGGLAGLNNGNVGAFPAVTFATSGGAATGGDVNIQGGPSQAALMLSALQALAGPGGTSRFGVSGLQFGIQSDGNPGIGYGAGGTGGIAYGGGAAQKGGAGTPGLVLITEYK